MLLLKLGKARRRIRNQKILIGRSRLFDEKHYRSQLPRLPVLDAPGHFCRTGWKRGLNPSPGFDTEFYLATYEDVRRAGVNPLVHYLSAGWKERRQPAPSFDVDAFLDAHPNVLARGENPAEACLRLYGSLAWRRADPCVPDIALAPGIDRFRSCFDEAFYRSTYDDLFKAKHLDAFAHYLRFGQFEDRDPSPLFDTYHYRTRAAAAGYDLRSVVEHCLDPDQPLPVASRDPDEICLMPEAETPRTELRVGVHVHAFYPHLLGEILPGLANMPAGAEAIVTVVTPADRIFAERLIARTGPPIRVEVRLAENRGRDLGPLFVNCRDLFERFDLVLHVHTKLSTHVGWGDAWRRYCLDQLVGSAELVSAVVGRFAREPRLGFLYPRNYYKIRRFTREERNEAVIGPMMKALGVRSPPEAGGYAAGSMAWWRTNALRALAATVTDVARFEDEAGQIDATFAHALERLMPAAARASGYGVRSYSTPTRTRLEPLDDMPAREDSRGPFGTRWMRDTAAIAREPPRPLAPLSRLYDRRALNIAWIVPGFDRGAGGHMSIFRMVRFLESFGHRQTLWLQNPVQFTNQADALRKIRDWYQPIGARVHVRFLPDDVRELRGDVLIATDCWTAFPAAAATNFKERFYFVQDDEPSFHPAGEMQLLAETTYDFGFAALCAGRWLLASMTARGLWARRWDLAADTEIYYPVARTEPGKRPWRIAFYARAYTPRRAVGLGLAALDLLHERGVAIHAELFGEDNLATALAAPHTRHGILTPEQLAELYRACDIGLVFSATNYSLIPLEMMACDLPVVELDATGTRAVFTNDEVAFAKPTPHAVADRIETLMRAADARTAQVARARDFVRETSWELSARAVEAALLERLEERGFTAIEPERIAKPACHARRAVSIVIPTHNAGPDFTRVLESVTAQVCDFAYDVLVLDSASRDGTPDIAKRFANRGVRYERIPEAAFQHGRTRNLGIAMTEGTHVALITQDARPANERWLSALVGGFARGSKVAGVTGRHAAHPGHDAFARRDLTRMFDALALLPDVVDSEIGLPSYLYPGSRTWQMLLHFYSDNNSAIARSVWKVLPYPEVEWGEDQLWADEALRLGFQKVYVDEAVVHHSHDYGPAAQHASAMTEGRFWAERFGHDLHPDPEAAIAERDAEDRAFALTQGIAPGVLKKRLALNRATVEGRAAGYRAASPNAVRSGTSG